jgi:hypothetical protein
MDITFKEIPEELIPTVKELVSHAVEMYHREKIQIPKEEYDKAEANITAFKEANTEKGVA